jgi:hypothetical protein
MLSHNVRESKKKRKEGKNDGMVKGKVDKNTVSREDFTRILAKLYNE